MRQPSIDFRQIFGVRGDAAGEVLRAHLLKQQARDRLQRFRKQDDDDDEDRRLSIDDLSDDDDGNGNSNGNGNGGNNGDSAPQVSATRHVHELAGLLVQAIPTMTRQAALHYLLRNKHGRALALAFLNKRCSEQQKDQTKMTSEQKLLDYAKSHGVVAICKYIGEHGPGGISEHQLTSLIEAHALRDRRPNETPAQAFSRAFCDPGPEGTAMRKAISLVKAAPFPAPEPTQTTSVSDDPEDPLALLQAKADDLRGRVPGLSKERAFAMVYSDPDNAALAAAERRQNRPRAVA